MIAHKTMVLFKSPKDVEIAESALMARQEEIVETLATVLCFLSPQENRRGFAPRRSGLDRRARRAAAEASKQRRGADRRNRQDRRVPPLQRINQLRDEMEQLFRLHAKLGEWQVADQ